MISYPTLVRRGITASVMVFGALIVLVLVVVVAPRLVGAAKRTDPALGLPVLAYTLAISVMVAFAVGSTVALAIIGASLFYLSDFTIGWSITSP